MLHQDLIKHGLEFCRAIDNHHYEMAPNGVYFPKQKAFVQGVFTTWVNGQDEQIDPNIVPVEGLNRIIKSGLNGKAWYIAPFVNNVEPLSTLTAATFTATMGEFTAYDEGSRVQWVIPTDPASGVYSNVASVAVFTASLSVGASPGVDIYGASVLGASAKSATTDVIVCCSLFSGARNLKSASGQQDQLSVRYDINATSV